MARKATSQPKIHQKQRALVQFLPDTKSSRLLHIFDMFAFVVCRCRAGQVNLQATWIQKVPDDSKNSNDLCVSSIKSSMLWCHGASMMFGDDDQQFAHCIADMSFLCLRTCMSHDCIKVKSGKLCLAKLHSTLLRLWRKSRD